MRSAEDTPPSWQADGARASRATIQLIPVLLIGNLTDCTEMRARGLAPRARRASSRAFSLPDQYTPDPGGAERSAPFRRLPGGLPEAPAGG
jgi:hypothetical protein